MEVKEPKESYEVEDDGAVLKITEYGPEDKYILSSSFDEPNYTQIPNQLLGSWENGTFIKGMMSDMSEVELKICLALCRVTYGFHRDIGYGSVRWLQDATGLSKQGAINGINRILERGLFNRAQKPGKTTVWIRNDEETGGQQNRPPLVNSVDLTSQQSRPYKETKKDQTAALSERQELDKIRAKLLKATHTQGEDDVERSDLALYIGQQMHSPLPQGDCTKLARTYTEQTKKGKVVHYSPDDLWRDQSLFREYVDEEIAYYKSSQNGTLAQRRKKLVNVICSYKSATGWGWLDWKEKKAGSQVQWQEV